MLTCSKCGQNYGTGDGEGGHCTQCCISFASNSAFDSHIKGKIEGRPHLDVTTAGPPWRQNKKGYWTPEAPMNSDAVSKRVSARP